MGPDFRSRAGKVAPPETDAECEQRQARDKRLRARLLDALAHPGAIVNTAPVHEDDADQDRELAHDPLKRWQIRAVWQVLREAGLVRD